MKKVELLAPAGNYESFLGAIHAGADAVYLGGSRFGARAFADNFSDEEIMTAIKYAHIYNRRVYLTVNTLLKEKECAEIYDYLYPFYNAGLDGVIIQDMGVFHQVGQWFPDLERHISTQMTVTGSYGAAYLKELGATRIVPARELSLEEIIEIKKTVDIEIETFIHGAVCYCYSGQCLFSSIIGGRSGNRGRCAQPCRLPYNGTDYYPLSLKDMCTITLIPELIQAGIDSFKIEGRMKSPEYAAGVTALYRKYIDSYYDNPNADFQVSRQDMEQLQALYIRSEISEGYYHRHNGKAMITLHSPGYAGREEQLSAKIREQYLLGDYRLSVSGRGWLYKNKKAEFEISYQGITVKAEGNLIEKALNQPLSLEGVKKQLKKSGNTAFRFDSMELDMDADAFMTVKALNELRRLACQELEQRLIETNGFFSRECLPPPAAQQLTPPNTWHKGEAATSTKLHVLVLNAEQLRAAVKAQVSRIYIASDLLLENSEMIEKAKEDVKDKTDFYLAMPYITRSRDKTFLQEIQSYLEKTLFAGVLIRNLEQLQWLKDIGWQKTKVTDANLYIWNSSAYSVYGRECEECCLPYELNDRELTELLQKTGCEGITQIIYGRIPMMITANCLANTEGKCGKTDKNLSLTDRYRKVFPVVLSCRHCYNIIYNTVPLSLHQNAEKLKKSGIHAFRLDFTTEGGNETEKILHFYQNMFLGSESDSEPLPFKDYTNGHYKRGVE